MKIKTFPTMIAMRIEREDNPDGDDYLVAGIDVAEALEGDGPQKVGIYKLEKVLVASRKVVTTEAKPRKR